MTRIKFGRSRPASLLTVSRNQAVLPLSGAVHENLEVLAYFLR